MPLHAGEQLGPYSIVAPLGAGGMGEVYRARDAKLQRDVALKVLPESVAADPDRLARFEREAQVLAALNHPHIGAIYGLEEAVVEAGLQSGVAAGLQPRKSIVALVLELVEGPTLADRIAHEPLAIDEASPIARQIAEALEAAHEAGIIHRDLKPANIKLRPDGTVKVLDFGLAKAFDPASGSGLQATGLTNSPTLTARGTEAGMILGTAAYMAPEQARGKPVDKRADIWAFGVVLFEMLTGRRLFEGETVSDTLAAVLTKDVDWSLLPAPTPPAIRQLLRRCLERDQTRRLRDIGEARLVLSDPAAAAPATQEATAPASRAWGRGAIATATLAGAVITAAAFWFWPGSTPAPPLTAFQIALPTGETLALVNRPAVSISRDGATVVFVARRDGVTRLFVKQRGDAAPRMLEGTEGASGPVLSPDGQRVAFIGGARLRLVGVNGGAVTDVMPVGDSRGVAWRDDQRLIVATQPVAGLIEVAALGGAQRSVTKLESGERTHRWPYVLPGGTAVVFTIGGFTNPDDYDDSRIEVADLTTGVRKTLVTGPRLAQYGSGDVLLTARLGVVSATPFDLKRLALAGPPVPVVQGVAGDKTTGASHFTSSADGTLAYIPGDPQGTVLQVVWADLKGTITKAFDVSGGNSLLLDPSVSPDGRRAALVVGDGDNNDVWIRDFARQAFTRFSFGGNNTTPVWTADGRTLYYSSIESTGRKSTIFRKPLDGSREAERVATLDARVYLKQVDEARGELLVDALRMLQQSDVERVSFGGGQAPRTQSLVATTFDETGASQSPDGRWLSYASDETGRYEIYVRDIGTGGGGRWQVSTIGGEEPRWSRDGRRLYFRSGSRFMAADVTLNPSFEASTPAVLFDGVYEYRSDTAVTYSLDGDGTKFLMIRPSESATGSDTVRVLLNWSPSQVR